MVRQATDDGGQRLHLDAGLAGDLDARRHVDARAAWRRASMSTSTLADGERMAERDQFVRALGRHDAGDARGAEHVALLGVALAHDVERLRLHDARGLRRPPRARSPALPRRRPCGLRRRAPRWVSCFGATRHGIHRGRRERGVAREQRARRRSDVGSAASGFRRPGRSTMPALASRARSAGVKMPLSPTMTRSGGTSCASRSQVASVVSKVLQVAVVDADQPRFQPQRALELGLVVHLDQHVHAERERRRFELARRSASSTAAMMMRMQSAPQRARFRHLIGVEHEILAQRRQRGRPRAPRADDRARPGTTARRSAPTGRPRRPPHRPRASAGGSKSSRISPFDGLAFLISAISA